MNKLKIIVFIAVFCILFSGVSWFFRTSENTIIYYEPKNTIDVLFIGSSHVHMDINPNLMWREEGVAACNFSSANQPLDISYYYIVEALKTQKPQLIVLDVLGAIFNNENGYQPNYQTVYGTLLPSINKLSLIQTSVAPEERISVAIDLLFFHTRWKNITEYSLPYTKESYMKKNMFRYKGFYSDPLIFLKTTPHPAEWNTTAYPSSVEAIELSEKNVEYLEKIIELSNEKGFELLFIKTPAPSFSTFEDSRKAVANIAEKYGVAFIDYNYIEHRDAMGLDVTTDFADDGHLNNLGARKLSHYLAKQVKETYALPDRRGDPRYKSWDEAADGYFRLEAIETAKTKASLSLYLEAIKDASQNLIFITSVNGGISEAIEPLKEQLMIFGINMNMVGQNSYISVYEPSSGYQYEDISATRKLHKNIYKDNIPINMEVISAGSEVGSIASIQIDGKEQAKNKPGLNIVIYDKEMERIFDSFYVDTFANEDEVLAIKR